MPRPDVDVSIYEPEFHDDLRWPLSGMNHPALEPRFPVAQELAIGVDWQTLCARGVQNRTSPTQKELLSYLRGWCDVQKRDVDGACADLTPLMGAMTLGMREAVKQDLANIIVGHGDADIAEHWLSKHNIRDAHVLDLLAANYVEVGSEADASTINRRAIDSDSRASDATRCRRLAKRIAFGFENSNTMAFKELELLSVPPKNTVAVVDPTCARLYHKVVCSREPGQMCRGYFTDENLDVRALWVLDAYFRWPRAGERWPRWWNIADSAMRGTPTPGAVELAVTALEAAVRANGSCHPEMAAATLTIIDSLRKDPAAATHTDRLKALESACEKAMRALPTFKPQPLKIQPVPPPNPSSVPPTPTLAPKAAPPTPTWTPTKK